MITMLLTIASAYLMFKLTVFFLKVLGKVLGLLLSTAGYAILFGFAFILCLPVLGLLMLAVSAIAALVKGLVAA